MPASLDVSKLDLRDALDLAILIEDEALERYLELSRVVGGRYKGDAADAFRAMAVYEQRHGSELRDRRQRLFGAAPRRVGRDQVEEVEAPGLGSPRVFMSARQAYEVALASEEKAHDFFAGALPHLQDEQVRALFDELRAEELDHRRMIADRLQGLPPGPDVEEDEADQPGSDPG